jgi:hypothetical protein
MAVTEDLFEEDVVVSPMEELPPPSELTPPYDQLDVEPMFSLNALTGFSSSQTLKLISYIKNRKVIILVDNGSTHSFIHFHISQEFDC